MLKYALWLLLSLRGRLGRFLFLATTAALGLAGSLLFAAARPEFASLPQDLASVSARQWQLLAALAVVVYVQQALAAKRFHDCGMSGWWSTAPIAGGAGLCEYFYSDARPAVSALGVRSCLSPPPLVGSLGYLWLLCLHPSEAEPNEFGRTDIPPEAPRSPPRPASCRAKSPARSWRGDSSASGAAREVSPRAVDADSAASLDVGEKRLTLTS